MFKITVLGVALAALTNLSQAASCLEQNVKLQVLGSGGPELNDGRASTSYLIWVDGQGRVLIDAGGGSSLNFEKSGAKVEDLQAVLFSHFHVDHSGDFFAYLKASFFSPRTQDLPVFGPAGNDRMPSTSDFIATAFGKKGVYRYLSNYVEPNTPAAFKLVPHDVALSSTQVKSFTVNQELRLSAIPVHHGPIAAVAWRVDISGCSISFSGDMNNSTGNLGKLAEGSQLLVAHNAVPEGAKGVARNLHMPPSEIGHLAQQAKVGQLLLSHRMKRTLGAAAEVATTVEVSKYYKGPVKFAEDLDIIELK